MTYLTIAFIYYTVSVTIIAAYTAYIEKISIWTFMATILITPLLLAVVLIELPFGGKIAKKVFERGADE